jgi:hypothetical protein
MLRHSDRLTDPDIDFAEALLPRARPEDEKAFRCATSSPVEPGRRLLVALHRLARGPFDPEAIVGDPASLVGLLVLDGLVALEAGRAQVSWLIGSHDLVRPWDLRHISLTQDTSWQALTNVRLALLDRDACRRADSAPSVAQTLVAKASQPPLAARAVTDHQRPLDRRAVAAPVRPAGWALRRSPRTGCDSRSRSPTTLWPG